MNCFRHNFIGVPGKTVRLTEPEHPTASLSAIQVLAATTGAAAVVAPVSDEGLVAADSGDNMLAERGKLADFL